MDLHFTKYRISTITSNANIYIHNYDKRINIDLIQLFNNIQINLDDQNNNYIYTSRLENKITGTKLIRGVYKKKKRTANCKRTFDNQISFVFKIDNGYYPNIKVFQNGNLHITGCRSIEDINKPLIVMINEIKRIYKENINIVYKDDKTNVLVEDLIYGNIQVFMINTDFKIYKNIELTEGFTIKRRVLHNILINNDNAIARFDPSTYPGVKIEYWWNKTNDIRDASIHFDKRNVKSKSNIIDGIKKITIAVFESGSVLITGAVTIDQVDEAYAYICNVILTNKDYINFNI